MVDINLDAYSDDDLKELVRMTQEALKERNEDRSAQDQGYWTAKSGQKTIDTSIASLRSDNKKIHAALLPMLDTNRFKIIAVSHRPP
jgi:hypothetical protein